MNLVASTNEVEANSEQGNILKLKEIIDCCKIATVVCFLLQLYKSI
jgi:hypothetical protein